MEQAPMPEEASPVVDAPGDDVIMTRREAAAQLSPATRRLMKICLILGVASLVLLPALAIGLAAWKYKQEKGHSPFSSAPVTQTVP